MSPLESAYRLALAEAEASWAAWWESEGTLFPDASALKAAEAAEARLHAAFTAVHRLRFESTFSKGMKVRDWAKVAE